MSTAASAARRSTTALGNAFAYTLVPLVAGLAGERLIDPLHGSRSCAVALVLTIAFDAVAVVVVYFQAWVHGDLVLRHHVGAYLRVLPWLAAASIVVAGAADG